MTQPQTDTRHLPGHSAMLPSGPWAPFLLRMLIAAMDRSRSLSLADRRRQYGRDFTLKLPLFGKTLVMVTHDPQAAKRADRVVHLDKGKIVTEASHA